MSLQIRLDCIFLGALITLPLLLAVLPAEVLLDSGQIAESSRRVMVNADEDTLASPEPVESFTAEELSPSTGMAAHLFHGSLKRETFGH
nr:hypothetical protein B296_00055650 [Ipomoea trifida]